MNIRSAEKAFKELKDLNAIASGGEVISCKVIRDMIGPALNNMEELIRIMKSFPLELMVKKESNKEP